MTYRRLPESRHRKQNLPRLSCTTAEERRSSDRKGPLQGYRRPASLPANREKYNNLKICIMEKYVMYITKLTVWEQD